VLDLNSDAIASATLHYAMSRRPLATPAPASATAAASVTRNSAGHQAA